MKRTKKIEQRIVVTTKCLHRLVFPMDIMMSQIAASLRLNDDALDRVSVETRQDKRGWPYLWQIDLGASQRFEEALRGVCGEAKEQPS